MKHKNNGISRRNFIRQGGITGMGLALTQNATGFTSLLSSQKNDLSMKGFGKAWLSSLYERGAATTYLKSKDELKYIGMPVGGINAGGMYLSGDGRLWLWDIFNLNQEGINPVDIPWKQTVQGEARKIRSRDGASYVAPPRSTELCPVEQGFALKIEYAGKHFIHRLNEEDWDEVSFEATYPIATITYNSKEIPVEVVLQAYSPFIPLDVDRSGIPASVFSMEIRNKGNEAIKVSIAGWLENKAALHTASINRLGRKNTTFSEGTTCGVYSTLETTAFGNHQVEKSFDYGTLCIASIDADAKATAGIAEINNEQLFATQTLNEAYSGALQKLIGNIITTKNINAGSSATVNYVIGWHFPNLMIDSGKVLPEADRGQYYDNQFKNAKEVVAFVAANFKELSAQTLLWKNTWYDSTLPYWFLDRTFINIGNLASTTSHRFKSGRFWAWEGVGSCHGNCTHVWHYAQATGRIFPQMERDNRERVDLGISLQQDGGIWFRGEYEKRPAIDGQAGRVLGCYREHQMNADNHFLKTNWDKIKHATQFIINQDKDKDGMEDTPLENTLDAIWDGEIAWLVGLCIAAVKAGEMMAIEMDDKAFAATCREYVAKGRQNMSEKLFNGEYFIHRPDTVKGKNGLGSYNTCHIDQVLGQSWAFQVGMERVIDKKQTLSALNALWKYNFIKDMGVYAETHKDGRPYALYGESGLVMNTNPKNESKPYGENAAWQIGYFNECMTGFEHQVASHMMAEGMVDEALAITKAIHDRYHAAKRNPFNEIECSDHYGRALASYGTFITACGFEYHGPKGYIRFAPKLSKENFKAAFTAAEGWGSFSQKISKNKMEVLLEVKYGTLNLNKISLSRNGIHGVKKIIVQKGNEIIPVKFELKENDIDITCKTNIIIKPETPLIVLIS